jgi:hypothetical protein
MKCRSISASPPLRLTNYNLSSIPKTLKNNSIQDKPLDPNGDQNAFFANGESPLIGMMTVINNLHTSTSSQIIRQIRPQVQLNDKTTRGKNDTRTGSRTKNLSTTSLTLFQ